MRRASGHDFAYHSLHTSQSAERCAKMDILAANFPDKVLRKDPLTEALKQFPSDPFIGNRGRTSSKHHSTTLYHKMADIYR